MSDRAKKMVQMARADAPVRIQPNFNISAMRPGVVYEVIHNFIEEAETSAVKLDQNGNVLDRTISGSQYFSGKREETFVNNCTNETLSQLDKENHEENPDPIPEREHLSNSGTKNRGKRARQFAGKARLQSKHKRMAGDSYLGYTFNQGKIKQNKMRDGRSLGPPCSSTVCLRSSLRRCSEFTEEERAQIIKDFWKLNWESKQVYIRSLVKYIEKKRSYVGENSRRLGSYVYYLQKGNANLQVCRSMFLSTLGLKIDMVRKWLETTKAITNKRVTTRKSKKTALSAFKIKNSERREYLKNFLAELPKVESHYCRKDTLKKYLIESFKTKTDVFEAYKKKCANDKEEPVSIFTFLTSFDEEKLSIYMPRKDQCDICVSYKTGQITDEQYQEHSNNEKRAKQEKEADKLAAEQKEQHTFTMDVQAVKMCPHLNASAIYYKQRLQVHNFSIFNLASHQCTNYWWNESEGDLSASSFVSCVIHHLTGYCLGDDLPIVIFSDGCGYQNRNQYLANALSNFAIANNKSVEQKYLEKGHTQMEVDSVHAKIEKKLKNRSICIPYDYVNVTKEARKFVKVNGEVISQPYDVEYLTHDFFYNYNHNNLRFSSIRPGCRKSEKTVSNLRALLYLPNGSVQFKTHFDDDYTDLPVRIKSYKQFELMKLCIRNV